MIITITVVFSHVRSVLLIVFQIGTEHCDSRGTYRQYSIIWLYFERISQVKRERLEIMKY
jgi:hypothetical protein